ncbi:hypothetical protein FHL15_008618 [Xylaria flabelliformis]|uniref:F-box domain-containing protein n=1 Tax=Xylaria flabelliformis TaxID=2512241 RepID=A0A553HR63_9PEZI|nr:hypothetical protein FHL15_008618 [Xylaria flabelliformis]
MFSVPVINKRVGAGLCPQPNFQEFQLRLLKGRKNLLLDLPPELRNIIYELAIGKGCEPTHRIPVTLWRTPSLAQVNRQLRNEVIPVYFGRDGGFKLLLRYQSCMAGGKTELRIGNDETDWDDRIRAAGAFEAVIRGIGSALYPAFEMDRLLYIDLYLLAKHAKLANRWIQLSYENCLMLIVEESSTCMIHSAGDLI